MRLIYLALAAGVGILIGVAIYFGQAVVHEAPAKQIAEKVDPSEEAQATHAPVEKKVAAKQYHMMDAEQFRNELPSAFRKNTPALTDATAMAPTASTAALGTASAPATASTPAAAAIPAPAAETQSPPLSAMNRAAAVTKEPASPTATNEPPLPPPPPLAADATVRLDAPALKSPTEPPALPTPPHSGVKYHVNNTDGKARTQTIVNK